MMNTARKTLILLAMATSSLFAGAASAADLVGDAVTCTRNGVACSGVSTAIVGSGIEFARPSTFDFNAAGVTLTELPGPSYVNPLVYSFSDLTNPFTSFSNLTFTGVTGLTASDITLQNGVLAFNLSGALFTSGSTVSLDLNTGAVPEPASWAMMILGMGAVGYAMRAAKRRSDDKFDAKIKRITYGIA